MNWATFSGRDVGYGGLEHLVPELYRALLVPRDLSNPLKLPQTLSCFQRHVLHVPVIRLDVSQQFLHKCAGTNHCVKLSPCKGSAKSGQAGIGA